MEKVFTEEQAEVILNKGCDEAAEIWEDEDKLERFLQRLEKKLEVVPRVGNKLANVPILVSLIKSYAKKEYTDIPIGTIVAITSALLYFVSPIDIIPDAIPGVGYLDDAAVVALCLKMVDSDVEEYKRWREKKGKKIDMQ